MRGLPLFLTTCTVLAALMVIPPEHARFVGLALLGVLFVASALAARIGYLIFRDFSRALCEAQRFAAGECSCSRHRLCAVCLESLRKEAA